MRRGNFQKKEHARRACPTTLRRRCAAAMRPNVKLLRPLIIITVSMITVFSYVPE